MNQLQIPTRFKLLGQTIEVQLVDHIASMNGTLGEARAMHNTIVLQKSVDGMLLPESKRLQILWHEILHLTLHSMGLDEMSADETFVDLMAGMIHQVLSTMEFDAPKPAKKKVAVKPKKEPVKVKKAKK